MVKSSSAGGMPFWAKGKSFEEQTQEAWKQLRLRYSSARGAAVRKVGKRAEKNASYLKEIKSWTNS